MSHSDPVYRSPAETAAWLLLVLLLFLAALSSVVMVLAALTAGSYSIAAAAALSFLGLAWLGFFIVVKF